MNFVKTKLVKYLILIFSFAVLGQITFEHYRTGEYSSDKFYILILSFLLLLSQKNGEEGKGARKL